MGLGVYEKTLVTDGHVCAAGARQWMVGWNVTVVVSGHFHNCCWGVGGDYRRSAIAVEAMDSSSMRTGRQAGGVGVKSGRLAGGGGLKRGVAVRESVDSGLCGLRGSWRWCWLAGRVSLALVGGGGLLDSATEGADAFQSARRGSVDALVRARTS